MGAWYRMQTLRNNGEWHFTTGLNDLESTRASVKLYRSVYLHNKYRVVEHLTDEIYDVIPDDYQPTNG
jgi:hypothetical protein